MIIDNIAALYSTHSLNYTFIFIN